MTVTVLLKRIEIAISKTIKYSLVEPQAAIDKTN